MSWGTEAACQRTPGCSAQVRQRLTVAYPTRQWRLCSCTLTDGERGRVPLLLLAPGHGRSADALQAYRQPVAGLGDRPHLPARTVAGLDADAGGRQQMVEEALRLHIGEVQPQAHV